MPEPNYRELANTLMQMATRSPVYDALSALAGRRGDPESRLDAYRAQNARAGTYMFDPAPVAQNSGYYGLGASRADLPPQLITAPQQTDQTMQQPQRSMGDENYDYDMDAWRRANPGVQMGPGQHYPDTYKKPNHPTFSDQSMYHGQGGAEGGHWTSNPDGTWAFTPGRTNLENFSADQLRDYFQRVEPGNTLNLPQPR
jgi:hypothetical protein